uniref:Collagen triple helix repeat-containing protein n=1 Tax=Candidatus Kentrum sp. MB TaxID=2138164 RepID=A0A450XPB1_9GAMM|nr:MAG: Collagen triple helix repeat-containing protein [Candidatus Kentron sp. MB]
MKTTSRSTPLSIAALYILFLTLAFISPARAAEHIVNFESDLSGWSAIKETSYFNWARHAGGTHSGHTGPVDAEEGNYYLYLEASRNTPGRIAYLQSPDFPETIKGISFHYHMYGAHMGNLELQGFDGSRWLQLWRVSGQQHGSHYAPWTRKEIDLSSKTIRKVRFKGTTGNGPGKLYRGDMAIDFITLTTNKETSAGHWSKSGDDIYFANGNVGVGMKDPKADLAVLGNLSKALTGRVGVLKGSTHLTGVGTRFTREVAVGDSLLIGDKVFIVHQLRGDAELILNAKHPIGSFNVTAYTDSDLLSVQTGAEVTALAIDKSGNVGIGAKAPTTRLDVRGGIRVGGETRCDAAREGTIRYNNVSNQPEFCNGRAWIRLKEQTGQKDPKGPQCETQCEKGDVGPKGDKGDTGPRGPKGDKGDTGQQGVQGKTGPRGPKGDQGIRGPVGPAGPPGSKGGAGGSFWSQSGANIYYSSGNIGIGTTTPMAKLEIKGGIKLGDDRSACNGAKVGLMKYISGFLYLCNGISWKALLLTNPEAKLTVSPASRFDMNVTERDNPGRYVTFTVTNSGPVASEKITTRLGNTTNFEFGANHCHGKTLAGGASCTVQVRPKGREDGAITGSLNILANNSPGISLAGTVTGFPGLYEFTAHTFTNCGQAGRSGPSLARCRKIYSTIWSNTYLTMTTNGIQEWIVPESGSYRIEASGASGGMNTNSNGGRGVRMRGDFQLKRRDVIHILVGQKGGDGSYDYGAGGGWGHIRGS